MIFKVYLISIPFKIKPWLTTLKTPKDISFGVLLFIALIFIFRALDSGSLNELALFHPKSVVTILCEYSLYFLEVDSSLLHQ